MIRISFYKTEGLFTGFSCRGHSGYSSSGSDIVCAAVTSAVRLTECSLNDVYRLEADVFVSEDQAEIRISIPSGSSGEKARCADNVISSLYIHLSALSGEYPNNIEVKEIKRHA